MQRLRVASGLLSAVFAFGLVAIADARVVERQTSPSGIAWMTGGVGMEERDEIASLEDEYTLKIITAAKRHTAYAADVTFAIRDESGETVLQGVADGPWILAKLPAGNYTVAVTSRGESQTQRVKIGGSGRTQIAFYFDRPNT